MYRILSIDGGGIRGVFPAAYLAELEKHIEQPIYKYFDLIAGTSTGGIIAMGLGLGFTAQRILQLYEEKGPEIFSQNKIGIWGVPGKLFRNFRQKVWGPKYNSRALREALAEILGDRKFGEAKTRLLIPTLDPKGSKIYLFKTAHDERFITDYKEYALDVAMATASAPTYFREYQTESHVGLVDGAIWANNPVNLAVVEGIGTLGWESSQIKVLSISCMSDTIELGNSFGLIPNASKLMEIVQLAQANGSIGIAKTLTGDVAGIDHKAIFRIVDEVPYKKYKIDDPRKIKSIKSRAISKSRSEKLDLFPVFFDQIAKPFEPIYNVE